MDSSFCCILAFNQNSHIRWTSCNLQAAEEAAARQAEGARQQAVGGPAVGVPQSSDSTSLSPTGTAQAQMKSSPAAVSIVLAAQAVTPILQGPAVAGVEAVPVAAPAPAPTPVGPPKVHFEPCCHKKAIL